MLIQTEHRGDVSQSQTRPPDTQGNNRKHFVVRETVSRSGGKRIRTQNNRLCSADQVLAFYREMVRVPMRGPPGLDSVSSPSRKRQLQVLRGSFFMTVGKHSQETLQTRPRTPNQTLLSNIANINDLHYLSPHLQNSQHLVWTLNGWQLKKLVRPGVTCQY